MKLQTKILLNRPVNPIDYHSEVLLLGSCFVENMGAKLNYFKFKTEQNPFGILFHPKAIEKLIADAVLEKSYTESDIFFHQERWHCFNAHSDLSNVSREALLNRLNTALTTTREYLQQASHIIITLGTAWAYRLLDSGDLVANCHKVSQKSFAKELLSIPAIVESLEKSRALILGINPKATILYTVSPVRHLKDGFVENQQSKAHLIAAIGQVRSTREEYFPSYELMMDELRDYRFYEADMVHPNALAIAYIWEKFRSVWIAESAYQTMDQIEEIQKGLGHRPFHPDSEQHKRFLTSLQDKITYLKKGYPYIKFD
ncbi:GSCFA domain-containing protein [Spongiimicrobium sp. 2-473A-2-J]|uniref:GSCFA domain-containing protein n=1 Tax=Eudoraea algarum TaxID=3417568 RepID=UPI003D3624AE